MIPMDTMMQRFFIGVLAACVLLGAYAYYDRGRTLECRNQAQTKGMTAVDAVTLCRK